MIKLPHCPYPNATDSHAHGLQPLPDQLPLLDLNHAKPFRSAAYRPVSIETFNHEHVLELIQVIAKSFVLNEPMNRHLVLPVQPPPEIQETRYLNVYGVSSFGAWEKENIFSWIVRLLLFDQLKDRLDSNMVDNYSKQLSLALLNDAGKVIGGALSIQIQSGHSGNAPDSGNSFSRVLVQVMHPIVKMLIEQEEAAIPALSKKYKSFEQALNEGKVGELFMIARSPALPTEDTLN